MFYGLDWDRAMQNALKFVPIAVSGRQHLNLALALKGESRGPSIRIELSVDAMNGC